MDFQFEYDNIPLVASFAFTDNGTKAYDIHREDTGEFVDGINVHPYEEVASAVSTWKSQAAQYVL